MIMPTGWDEANRKSRIDRRLEKARQLNNRIKVFIADVNKDPIFSDKQKRRIINTVLNDFKD